MTEAPSGALTIQTVGVIGAGAAGREFARECVRAGFSVVLEDVMPARLRQARAELMDNPGTEAQGHLEIAGTVEDAARFADLLVDFVPDELESKLEILSMADRMAPPRTILCTPTHTLSIADLASCVYRPDRCLAVRDLSGPDIRVITHPALSAVTLTAIDTFLHRLSRKAVYETDQAPPMLTRNIG